VNKEISFIGAGNMASTLIGGLINKGYPPENIWASDPGDESLERLKALAPINTTHDNEKAVSKADIVLIAVKPQVLQHVVLPLKLALAKTKPLVISIAAGITLNSLEKWLGEKLAIVRCMPNTPALVQCAATGLIANTQVTVEQQQYAKEILGAVGIALWVDNESLLDAVTAVSGSGPAYFFLIMETMIDVAIELGLDPELAEQLTLQTAFGAATMANSGEVNVNELRKQVTSPGGTTEVALKILESKGIRSIFEEALTAACNRSRELATMLDKG